MSSSRNRSKRELAKINELITDYKKKGYEVLHEPDPALFPFLGNRRPDLIVLGPNENVIVEVKSKESINDEKLVELAKLIESTEGWRLDLVVTNPRSASIELPTSDNKVFSIREIQALVEAAQGLKSEKGKLDAALITIWSAFEAVSRIVLAEHYKGTTKRRLGTLELVKSLYSYGYLNKTDYNRLLTIRKWRNEVIHGYKSRAGRSTDINFVEKIIGNVLKT